MTQYVDKCLLCKGDSGVVDSRPVGETVRRRRKCLSCWERWTIFEVRREDRKDVRVDAVRINRLRLAAEFLTEIATNLEQKT